MRRRGHLPIVAAAALAAVVAGPIARGETVRSKDLEITVRKDGCGLIDEVRYRGQAVLSTATTGHTALPGFDAAAGGPGPAKGFADALAKLDADAPCKASTATSPRGHKLITLENGLLKVTVMTWFGGRIIGLTSKLTGANFLDNPYGDKSKDLTKPEDIGGIWGELSKKIFQPTFVTRTADAIVLTLRGEDGDVRIAKTLRLRRGSAALEIEQTQTNGDKPRTATNHLFGRYRVGGSVGPEDVLWGSSRGEAVLVRRGRSSPSCHTDPRTDRWAALVDTKERAALVSVFAGPVTRIGTWIREEFYQFEHFAPDHYTLAPGGKMTTTVHLAPCFNLGGVALATDELAVGIVPVSAVSAAGADAWPTSVGAVAFAKAPPRRLTLRAHLTDRHGKTVRKLPDVTVDCPFLVARPRQVDWPVAGLPPGVYRMHVAVGDGDKPLGTTALTVRRAAAGPILELLHPAKAEAGRAFPVLGSAERGEVKVASVTKVDARTLRVKGRHVFGKSASPFTTDVRLNAAGDGFEITHALVCGAEPPTRVRAAGVALPLVLGGDLHKVRTRVGSEKLTDSWRVDQTDEMAYTMTISDYFSRWPLWRLGGVLQDAPTHFSVWKASDWDVAPTTTLQGLSAPGWVEVNNGRRGVRVEIRDMAKAAPKAIVADGIDGSVRAYFFPPQAPPIALAPGGPDAPSRADRLGWRRGRAWTNTVSVRFHAGPHARGFRREVSDEAFRAVLTALGETTVTRSMTSVALPGRTFEQCARSIIDSDLSLGAYLRLGARGRSGLRRLCQAFHCKEGDDLDGTMRNLISALKEKYK